jgi:hypothetical protein
MSGEVAETGHLLLKQINDDIIHETIQAADTGHDI